MARVDVIDGVLLRAVTSAMSDAGWTAGGRGPVVSDRLPADLLVVPPSARHCLEALTAVTDGAARGGLTRDELDGIGLALTAMAGDLVVVSRTLIAVAAPVRTLTDRQADVLGAVTAGWRNGEIAAKLHMSIPSVKRELAALRNLLDAPSRAALARAGHRLGFAPDEQDDR